jgi:ApaG protein
VSDIIVTVTPNYLPEQSNPEKSLYSFSYHISIANHGDRPTQLVSRRWIITDGNAHVKEVHGAGVVGEQPFIAPGKSHHYTSGVTLETQVGTMEGSYQMVSDSGEEFDVIIPTFLLSVPGAIH